MPSNRASSRVDQFILERIDTVPHLEALLLLWRSQPQAWPTEELSRALYIPLPVAQNILNDLVRLNLVASRSNDAYFYRAATEELDKLVREVEDAYRRELVRISRMIHAKASPSVLEFARAFKLKKKE